MFVDVGLMSDRPGLFFADGSHETEPTREQVINAIEDFNDRKYVVVEDERPVKIFKDGLMGFWRFSAIVVER